MNVLTLSLDQFLKMCVSCLGCESGNTGSKNFPFEKISFIGRMQICLVFQTNLKMFLFPCYNYFVSICKLVLMKSVSHKNHVMSYQILTSSTIELTIQTSCYSIQTYSMLVVTLKTAISRRRGHIRQHCPFKQPHCRGLNTAEIQVMLPQAQQ